MTSEPQNRMDVAAKSSWSDESTDTLVDCLERFRNAVQQVQGTLETTGGDGRSLQAQFLTMQQQYQQHLSPALQIDFHEDRYQSWHTEISRSLRLLGMDVAFLQTAQRSPTAQKRRSLMQQRLQALLNLCEGLALSLSPMPTDDPPSPQS